MACPAGWFRRGFHFHPPIMHNDDIQDQRSGFANDNIQELLDAAVSAGHALQVGAQQYQTPSWLARGLASQLPSRSEPTLDPQCAAGNLLMAMTTNSRFGWDLDARHAESNRDFINRIRGNCVKLGATLAEIAPDLRFPCIVANPPFGIRWKTESGSIDSTEWTWQFIASRLAKNGFGFLISSRSTIERLGLHEHSWTYAYQTFPKGIWENTLVEIGVVHFINWNHRPSATCPWPARVVRNWDHLPSTEEMMAMSFRAPVVYPDYFYAGDAWRNLETIAKEESSSRSRFNIYLTERGILRTYLSTRNRLKLRHDQIERLFTINDAHPLTLTTDRATRKLLAEVVSSGIYTIEPEAEKAIKDALAEVANISCPIVPITDFEKVAYADEEDHLKARLTPKSVHSGICTTPGKLYELRTGSYTFSEKYYRTKLHWDEDTDKTRVEQHECVLSGSDRFIEFTDDRGHVHRFMERPRKREAADRHYEHPEALLFDLFEEPVVPTVAEVMASEYRSNLDSMRFNERLNGFKYFPGQLDYYARMSTKKSGLVAAAVGTGKTLGALTLVAVKSPGRTIIIAPQGTMRSTEDDEEVEYQASQWVQEIQRFASSEPVFQLFSEADWRKVLHANGGVAPNGIYITYPQAYFSNHAFEVIPHTWDDTPAEVERKFCERAGLKFNKDRAEPDYYSNGVGKHDKAGIRCIAEPSLATIVASEMGEWDMVIIDEAHLCFPYSTRVMTREHGSLPIGEIVERKLAVHVLSSNLNSDVTEWRRVSGHFKNAADRPLVRVIHERGSFICTDDHKIRVRDGWKRAKALLRGEELRVVRPAIQRTAQGETHSKVLQHGVLGSEDQQLCRSARSGVRPIQEAASIHHQDLRSLRERVHVQEDVGEAGSNPDVLRSRLHNGSADNATQVGRECTENPVEILGMPSRGKEPGVGSENAVEQSDARSCRSGEDAALVGRPDVSFEGRERRSYSATDCAPCIATVRGCDGAPDCDGAGEGAIPLAPTLLQSGHRNPERALGDRGGRELAPATEVEVLGSQEGVGTELSRVVRVEVLQQRGGIPDDHGRGADHVYCLEVEDNHNFFAEGVLVSNCCNLDATITKNLLRLQPKFRFALTATPIPNIITNLFSLMGWLCVDDWYLGDRRNAAWPYAVTERGRFESTFLSWETDITQQQQAKAKGKKSWKNVGIRTSPIISSPARLLKLLKPTMAYISKEACNPDLKPCEIIDVRVPVGSEQARLYNYWLERRHYLSEYKSMLTIARVQSSRLRGICGAPVGLDYNRILVPKTLPTGETVSVPIVPCRSNFNPKTVAILKVAALCLGRQEQVVIVSARVGQSNELARRFTEAGVPIARIDSTVAPELHAAEANRFKRGDARVMLMGIKCAQGHSFDQCPNLIIGSLEWSYGTLAQAQGRVWRLTSPKPVKVWVVLHENTIEEVLFDRVATKRDAATLCLHGRRVPRDFKPMDMAEILAEHIESYRAQTGKPESECEAEWPELCRQIANAHRGIEPEVMAA